MGAQSRGWELVCPVAGEGAEGWGLGSQGCGLSGSDQGGLWGGPWWRKEGVKRRHVFLGAGGGKTAGPQQGPSLQSFQGGGGLEATRGSPPTAEAAPVETEQVEQLLWGGQLWGGDRTTPGASKGSRTLPEGALLKCKLLALS